MKDLKTILEVGKNINTKDDKKTLSVSVSLNEANLQNILFALAYTYKWDDEADKVQRAQYKSLYLSLYKEASKVFGKEDLENLGIENDIEKVQTRY